jgi:hypothetical protein
MKRLIVFLLLSTICFTFKVPPVSANSLYGGTITPDEALDCGVWAYTPYQTGTSVVGLAEVSCASKHSSIRVVAGLRDSAGRYNSTSKTCYNTSTCQVSTTLSYIGPRTWQTDVSGYVSSWNAYLLGYQITF